MSAMAPEPEAVSSAPVALASRTLALLTVVVAAAVRSLAPWKSPPTRIAPPVTPVATSE